MLGSQLVRNRRRDEATFYIRIIFGGSLLSIESFLKKFVNFKLGKVRLGKVRLG